MPHFLLQLLLSLAVNLGIPWIVQHFPGIPAEVIEVIRELINALENQKAVTKSLVSDAKLKVAACYGPSCEVKKE